MQVVEGSAQLIREKLKMNENKNALKKIFKRHLHVNNRHEFLVLCEVTTEAIHGVQHKFQHQIEVQFIRLLAIGIEAVFHHDNVPVV